MEPTPRLRVLVVEDEALIAENLRLTLEDLGYEVPATCFTFAEAQGALAGPTRVPADLVLLDINLGSPDPAASGLALAELLRRSGGPPFVFLTAYSDLDTIRQATQYGPSGYLIKPTGGPALFAAIQSALEHAATRQLPPSTTPAPAPAPAFFFVKLGERTHKLLWTDIQRLEAGKNYVTLYPTGQRIGYPIRGSLTYVLEQLLPPGLRSEFLRVNRRVSLNRTCITAYDDEYVYCGTERFENGRLVQKQLGDLLDH